MKAMDFETAQIKLCIKHGLIKDIFKEWQRVPELTIKIKMDNINVHFLHIHVYLYLCTCIYHPWTDTSMTTKWHALPVIINIPMYNY